MAQTESRPVKLEDIIARQTARIGELETSVIVQSIMATDLLAENDELRRQVDELTDQLDTVAPGDAEAPSGPAV